ncbi:hypothetical protein PROFUN_15364 [Planoprotostelium fungivorum]|uniref:Uncharacterized protein n=1 Tax=Planoprotostelium fungivorum TaxID=1890364 RepID=A0A2P6MW22_9EUKA|nr:hypothetical protein PROFUN_15364 [Planoprotostelium fungivorum]
MTDHGPHIPGYNWTDKRLEGQPLPVDSSQGRSQIRERVLSKAKYDRNYEATVNESGWLRNLAKEQSKWRMYCLIGVGAPVYGLTTFFRNSSRWFTNNTSRMFYAAFSGIIVSNIVHDQIDRSSYLRLLNLPNSPLSDKCYRWLKEVSPEESAVRRPNDLNSIVSPNRYNIRIIPSSTIHRHTVTVLDQSQYHHLIVTSYLESLPNPILNPQTLHTPVPSVAQRRQNMKTEVEKAKERGKEAAQIVQEKKREKSRGLNKKDESFEEFIDLDDGGGASLDETEPFHVEEREEGGETVKTWNLAPTEENNRYK